MDKNVVEKAFEIMNEKTNGYKSNQTNGEVVVEKHIENGPSIHR